MSDIVRSPCIPARAPDGGGPRNDAKMSAPTLTLFVSGDSPTSRRARENLARIAAHDLPSGWDTEVVDVQTDPGRAEQARILATPTLAYDHPDRSRRIVGDLSERTKVLEFLGIEMRSETP